MEAHFRGKEINEFLRNHIVLPYAKNSGLDVPMPPLGKTMFPLGVP